MWPTRFRQQLQRDFGLTSRDGILAELRALQITLLVISGSEASTPASEWYLNPDDLMIPARAPQLCIRRSAAEAASDAHRG